MFIHVPYISHHKQCLYTHKNTEMMNEITQGVSISMCDHKVESFNSPLIGILFPLHCKLTVSQTTAY